MIRQNKNIKGLTIPGPTYGTTRELKERGMADDTATFLGSTLSIAPLIHTLQRFQSFSKHEVNLKKTIAVLLGRLKRLAGPANRGDHHMQSTDIKKWQPLSSESAGKYIGYHVQNLKGMENLWNKSLEQLIAKCQEAATITIQRGLRGRRLDIRAQLAPEHTFKWRNHVPTKQVQTRTLKKAQVKINKVMLPDHSVTIKAETAHQPISELGLDLLNMETQMNAEWGKLCMKTILDPAERPYKNYVTDTIAQNYGPLGKYSLQLLHTNCSFSRIQKAHPNNKASELMKAALRAHGTLPPLRPLETEPKTDNKGGSKKPQNKPPLLPRKAELLYLALTPTMGTAQAIHANPQDRTANTETRSHINLTKSLTTAIYDANVYPNKHGSTTPATYKVIAINPAKITGQLVDITTNEGQLSEALNKDQTKTAIAKKLVRMKGAIPPEAIIAVIDTSKYTIPTDCDDITAGQYPGKLTKEETIRIANLQKENIQIIVKKLRESGVTDVDTNKNGYLPPPKDFRDILEQLIAFHPHYKASSPHGQRSTLEDETEMILWATYGVTHIKHLMKGHNADFMTRSEFHTKYPQLDPVYYTSLINTAIPEQWKETLRDRRMDPHRETWHCDTKNNRLYHIYYETKTKDKATTTKNA